MKEHTVGSHLLGGPEDVQLMMRTEKGQEGNQHTAGLRNQQKSILRYKEGSRD